MTDSVQILRDRLRTARKPEDIFGQLPEGPVRDRLRALKRVFGDPVVLIHPDKNPDVPDAGKHMARLVSVRAEAEKLINDGTYGRRATTSDG